MRTNLESGAIVHAIIDASDDVRVYALLSLREDHSKEVWVDVTMILNNTEFDNIAQETREYYQ